MELADYDAEGSTVLDPFAEAGTTAITALRNGRNFIGIELNSDYVEIARAEGMSTLRWLFELQARGVHKLG